MFGYSPSVTPSSSGISLVVSDVWLSSADVVRTLCCFIRPAPVSEASVCDVSTVAAASVCGISAVAVASVCGVSTVAVTSVFPVCSAPPIFARTASTASSE